MVGLIRLDDIVQETRGIEPRSHYSGKEESWGWGMVWHGGSEGFLSSSSGATFVGHVR